MYWTIFLFSKNNILRFRVDEAKLDQFLADADLVRRVPSFLGETCRAYSVSQEHFGLLEKQLSRHFYIEPVETSTSALLG